MAGPGRSSLLGSLLFRPPLAPQRLPLVGLAVGLAAAAACRRVAGVEILLKWPNDLLIGERKLGGLLAELVASPGPGIAPAVVVGIGVNVVWPADWPSADDPEAVAVAAGAATLAGDAGYSGGPGELATALLPEVNAIYGQLTADGGTRALVARYRERCATLGRDVAIDLPAGRIAGLAVDVDDDGRLVVAVDGARRSFAAGDVVHLR